MKKRILLLISGIFLLLSFFSDADAFDYINRNYSTTELGLDMPAIGNPTTVFGDVSSSGTSYPYDNQKYFTVLMKGGSGGGATFTGTLTFSGHFQLCDGGACVDDYHSVSTDFEANGIPFDYALRIVDSKFRYYDNYTHQYYGMFEIIGSPISPYRYSKKFLFRYNYDTKSLIVNHLPDETYPTVPAFGYNQFMTIVGNQVKFYSLDSSSGGYTFAGSITGNSYVIGTNVPLAQNPGKYHSSFGQLIGQYDGQYGKTNIFAYYDNGVNRLIDASGKGISNPNPLSGYFICGTWQDNLYRYLQFCNANGYGSQFYVLRAGKNEWLYNSLWDGVDHTYTTLGALQMNSMDLNGGIYFFGTNNSSPVSGTPTTRIRYGYTTWDKNTAFLSIAQQRVYYWDFHCSDPAYATCRYNATLQKNLCADDSGTYNPLNISCTIPSATPLTNQFSDYGTGMQSTITNSGTQTIINNPGTTVNNSFSPVNNINNNITIQGSDTATGEAIGSGSQMCPVEYPYCVKMDGIKNAYCFNKEGKANMPNPKICAFSYGNGITGTGTNGGLTSSIGYTSNYMSGVSNSFNCDPIFDENGNFRYANNANQTLTFAINNNFKLSEEPWKCNLLTMDPCGVTYDIINNVIKYFIAGFSFALDFLFGPIKDALQSIGEPIKGESYCFLGKKLHFVGKTDTYKSIFTGEDIDVSGMTAFDYIIIFAVVFGGLRLALKK